MRNERDRLVCNIDTATEAAAYRSGRSVRSPDDAVRTRLLGEALAHWWRHGGEWCRVHLAPRTVLHGPATLDLRRELLTAMQGGGRRSILCGLLSVDGAPAAIDAPPPRPFPAETHEAIGADFLAWWHEAEGYHVVADHRSGSMLDLRSLVMNALRGHRTALETGADRG